ncbi:MAG: hypothetical protein AAAB35_24355 [Phyllobacterium sp.]|uniref:hypothetical protein n=1 Tax=Phyllobacterium sp. TaxID=1871046 RepID=UPI0030F24F7D
MSSFGAQCSRSLSAIDWAHGKFSGSGWQEVTLPHLIFLIANLLLDTDKEAQNPDRIGSFQHGHLDLVGISEFHVVGELIQLHCDVSAVVICSLV